MHDGTLFLDIFKTGVCIMLLLWPHWPAASALQSMGSAIRGLWVWSVPPCTSHPSYLLHPLPSSTPQSKLPTPTRTDLIIMVCHGRASCPTHTTTPIVCPSKRRKALKALKELTAELPCMHMPWCFG